MKKLLLLLITTSLYTMHNDSNPLLLLYTDTMHIINSKQKIIQTIHQSDLKPEEKKELISEQINEMIKIINNFSLPDDDEELV